MSTNGKGLCEEIFLKKKNIIIKAKLLADDYLSKREVEIQKHETEIREKHRIKMEQLKKHSEAEEMAALGKEAGVVAK